MAVIRAMDADGGGLRTGMGLVGIDAGRGIAALMVVLYHVARHVDRAYGVPGLEAAFRFGHAGVDFFFVISGFIILHVHRGDIGRPGRLGRYAARRITRLYPPYWLALGLTAASAWAGGHLAAGTVGLAVDASLLPSDRPLVLGVAWTLRYEALFYAAFGFLVLNRAAGTAFMACWFCAAFLASSGFAHPVFLPAQFRDPCVLEFPAGMILAVAAARWARCPGRFLLAVGVTGFAAAGLCEDMGLLDGYGAAGRLAYGAASCLCVLGAASASMAGWLRVPLPLSALGSASYSVYLFQFWWVGLAWQAVMRLSPSLPWPLAGAVLSLSAIVGGLLTSRFVERPLTALARRMALPARPGPASA